jgi:hypothetical protein
MRADELLSVSVIIWAGARRIAHWKTTHSARGAAKEALREQKQFFIEFPNLVESHQTAAKMARKSYSQNGNIVRLTIRYD